jgi:hypothetical protein
LGLKKPIIYKKKLNHNRKSYRNTKQIQNVIFMELHALLIIRIALTLRVRTLDS